MPAVGEYKIILPGLRRVIQAKTSGQQEYLQAIAQHDIVVGIGPAGTGKTYLAVAAAVDALSRKRVRRIVLARPAVEARESLGFLPGDLLLPAGAGCRAPPAGARPHPGLRRGRAGLR